MELLRSLPRGTDGPPSLALVLSATIPSGDPVIVDLRRRLLALLPWLPVPVVSPTLPLLEHGSFESCPPSSSVVYIGCGTTDPQSRPSALCNPFSSFHSAVKDIALFRAYLGWRADLRPLLGALMGL